MVKYSPIFCDWCVEDGYPEAPPESEGCPHFSITDPDTIWLAIGGRAIMEKHERNDREHTKYYLHHLIDLPDYPAFTSVVHEKNSWSETFKLPVGERYRIHYELTPNKDQFPAAVHGPELDPDPPAPLTQQFQHCLEVVGHNADRSRRRLHTDRYQDPMYIRPEDRNIAHDYIPVFPNHTESTNQSVQDLG